MVKITGRKPLVKWNDLPSQTRQKILKQVQDGQLSMRAAAAYLGVSKDTISRRIKDENLNPIGRPRKGTVARGGKSPPLQSSQKTLLSWLTHPLAQEKSNVRQSCSEVPTKWKAKGPEGEADQKAVCPTCGQVRVPEGRDLSAVDETKCQEKVRSDVKKSHSGEFLSGRLTATVLVLPTKDGRFRRYARTNTNDTTEYFRCTCCAWLRRKEGGQTLLAKVTVQEGQIIGDADPEHHPDCLPLEKNEVLAQQHDREARLLLKQGKMQNPREAWNKVQYLPKILKFITCNINF